MVQKDSIDSLPRMLSQPKTLLALGISAIFVLSIFHHTMDFWGASWEQQLLVLALIPFLAVPIHLLAAPLWERAVNTSWRRWCLFLLPALVIVSYITWRVFESPLLWHTLEIAARENSGRTKVELLEIRNSYGEVVPFSKILERGDWTVQEKVLIAMGSGAQPLRYAFLGPFREPVKFRFLTSPAAADVKITLDGRSLVVGLQEAADGQRVVQLDPAYKLGIPGKAIILVVVAIDVLALLALFTVLWLIQDIHQTTQPPIESQNDFSREKYWKWLGIVLALSFVLHTINYFSIPLQLGEDSPGYLDAAVHWVKYQNLEGASPVRGPGTPFVFLPAILLFGRNPWGIKLLLHLLAFASVGLTYHLGWQLTRKYGFAFLAGLLTALNPDIFFFSNSVMSEIPNIFFVLLFCTFLLTALETISFRWMLATILVACFTVLIRTENIVLILFAVLFLTIRVIQRKAGPLRERQHELRVYARQMGLALLLGALPILAWSVHNYQQHGFFGLSNYAAEVFYTGWVYEGEASHIPITDRSSPAVQIINDVYWGSPDVVDPDRVPTGWNVHDRLVEKGYSSEEAFALLKQAALDSITKDLQITWQVIVVKIHDSFSPQASDMITFALPGEENRREINWIKAAYFDEEELVIPPLVLLQRRIYEVVTWFYVSIYPGWAWFGVGAMLLGLYRKPVIPWLPIVLITLFRVGVPNTFGLSVWRFVVSGLPLLQLLALAGLHSLYVFALLSLRRYKSKAPATVHSPS